VKVGDLVSLKNSAFNILDGQLCLIVDIVTHTETYKSSGCKKYVVLTATGRHYQCWQGDLAVINASR
jgi:hypothetical protein